MRRASPRIAFTLFEVAISLAIVAVAVIGSALVMTGGLRAQEASRFRLYAAAKAIEMADVYAQADHQFLRQAYEADELGRSPFTWNQTDLERALQGGWFGTLVLPDTIARRLDSQGDEIAHLLDAGGKLFYASPRPAMAADGEGGHYYTKGWTGIDLKLASEAQKLVIGVIGPAQQDALLCHPCIGWPYHSFYPSPPDVIYGEAKGWTQWPERDAWERQATAHGWPAVDEMRAVCAASRPDPANLVAVQAYIDAARALVVACGVAVDPSAGGPVPRPPQALPAPPWNPSDPDVFPPPWRVLAMRWLANAALMRTGDRLPPASAVEAAYAVATHEASLAWAHRYARADPYDWGANRIVQEMCALDYPLLQFDLFSTPRAIDDGAGGIDRSWLVSTARPVRNVARARLRRPGRAAAGQPRRDSGELGRSGALHPHRPLRRLGAHAAAGVLGGGLAGLRGFRVDADRDLRRQAAQPRFARHVREAPGLPRQPRARAGVARRRSRAGWLPADAGRIARRPPPVPAADGRRVRRGPQRQRRLRSRPPARHHAHARDAGHPLQFL